uniref:tyrosine-type recombinase/integrase n=1 Tax=Actinomadura sp. TaxID=1989 RepID=UPI0037CA2833
HFHDLRHTGNTFAAESGATLRDLMERMGHDSVRAAMIYQHRTVGGNRAIAQAMDNKINSANRDDDDGPAAPLALVG